MISSSPPAANSGSEGMGEMRNKYRRNWGWMRKDKRTLMDKKKVTTFVLSNNIYDFPTPHPRAIDMIAAICFFGHDWFDLCYIQLSVQLSKSHSASHKLIFKISYIGLIPSTISCSPILLCNDYIIFIILINILSFLNILSF